MPILLNVKEDEPKTFKDAMASRNSAFLKKAINNEMESLMYNNTWYLSDLPQGSKAIGCKWVFNIKYNSNGSILCFKVRLVA